MYKKDTTLAAGFCHSHTSNNGVILRITDPRHPRIKCVIFDFDILKTKLYYANHIATACLSNWTSQVMLPQHAEWST